MTDSVTPLPTGDDPLAELRDPITNRTPLEECNRILGIEKDPGTRKIFEVRKKKLELEQGRWLASRQS